MIKLLIWPVICSPNNGIILKASKRFAGHSKWANIKHIKAVKDAQKSLIFDRLGRQMRVAITEGTSANPEVNVKLTQIIEQAKRSSMPAATINGILKAAQLSKSNAKPAMVEVRGPGGCILLVELFTDNFSKTKQALNTLLRKNNGKFADPGAKHLFHHKGVVETEMTGNVETATEHAIQIGAEDVREVEQGDKKIFQFQCEPKLLTDVKNQLEALKYKVTSAEVIYVPHTHAHLCDKDLEQAGILFDKLETHSDVVKVYDNIA